MCPELQQSRWIYRGPGDGHGMVFHIMHQIYMMSMQKVRVLVLAKKFAGVYSWGHIYSLMVIMMLITTKL